MPSLRHGSYDELYGVGLLDDLHNYFPALLYEPNGFDSVQDVLQYLASQTRRNFDLYTYGQDAYMGGDGQRRSASAFEGRSAAHSSAPVYQFYGRTNASRSPTLQTPLQTTMPQMQRNDIPITPPRRNSESHVDEIEETNITIPITQSVLSALLGAGTTLTPPLTLAPQNRLATLTTLMGLMNPNNPMMEFTLGNRNFMEPVSIRPTSAQIAAATRVAPLPLETETCTICQDSITPSQPARQILHCEHWFHRDCIDPWFQQNVRCPVCRFDIREHGHTAVPRRSRTSSVEDSQAREN